MASSKATTVKAYLAELPADRRKVIEPLRDAILENLGKGYEEGMSSYGMIYYYVPHSVYPAGYHCDPKQPLPFAGIASQKNYISLYLMGLYCGCGDGAGEETPDAKWFREAWQKTGKKLDMGKCCIRFRKLEDVPLEVVGKAIKRIPVEEYIAHYEEGLAKTGAGAKRKRAGTKKAAAVKKTAGAKKKTAGAKR
jgi:hypothetical protein